MWSYIQWVAEWLVQWRHSGKENCPEGRWSKVIFKIRREWQRKDTTWKTDTEIIRNLLFSKMKKLSVSCQHIYIKVSNRGQFCCLACSWPFVKKMLSSCCFGRQMDGWRLWIVLFWQRNWGTKCLIASPNLPHP